MRQKGSQHRKPLKYDMQTPSNAHSELAATVGFIARYASYLMGSGVHTSRVVRNSRRIGSALGIEINLAVFPKSIIVSGTDAEGESFSRVTAIAPCPIDFERNADLSALSWEAFDRKLTLRQIEERYEQLCSKPRLDPMLVMILAGLANASFCRLFGGDLQAMGIVFTATLFGFFVKQKLIQRGLNHFLVFIAAAFAASLMSSMSLILDTTSDVALATSVLFLIPGVPLINGFIDIIEGHILTGISRLTAAIMLVACIAIGLSATLMMVKSELL